MVDWSFFSSVRWLVSASLWNLLTRYLVSITIGILASYWIDYGSNYIGGTRCAPDIPYTGGTSAAPEFDPYNDVGPDGCVGQSDASWRVPFALQIFPALVLGIGMLFFPDSPRWLLMKDRDDDALATLSKLRRQAIDYPPLVAEYLEIKASVLLENSFAKENFGGLTGIKLHAAQVSHSLLILYGTYTYVPGSTSPFSVPGQGLSGLRLGVALCSSNNSWDAMVGELEQPHSYRTLQLTQFAISFDLLCTHNFRSTRSQW